MQGTLFVVEPQALLFELFKQNINLGLLVVDNLLLTLVHKAAVGSQSNVPQPKRDRHVQRRKLASVRCRRMKTSGADERLRGQ